MYQLPIGSDRSGDQPRKRVERSLATRPQADRRPCPGRSAGTSAPLQQARPPARTRARCRGVPRRATRPCAAPSPRQPLDAAAELPAVADMRKHVEEVPRLLWRDPRCDVRSGPRPPLASQSARDKPARSYAVVRLPIPQYGLLIDASRDRTRGRPVERVPAVHLRVDQPDRPHQAFTSADPPLVEPPNQRSTPFADPLSDSISVRRISVSSRRPARRRAVAVGHRRDHDRELQRRRGLQLRPRVPRRALTGDEVLDVHAGSPGNERPSSRTRRESTAVARDPRRRAAEPSVAARTRPDAARRGRPAREPGGHAEHGIAGGQVDVELEPPLPRAARRQAPESPTRTTIRRVPAGARPSTTPYDTWCAAGC